MADEQPMSWPQSRAEPTAPALAACMQASDIQGRSACCRDAIDWELEELRRKARD